MVAINDTIYALSSGALPSGVAVIRISGPEAVSTAQALCEGEIPPRKAVLKTIRSRNGDAIDQGLVLSFPAPGSFTGEDCVELQIHGGRAVVVRLLDELRSFPALRHAEAGEFSKRAFQNGKLDLVEIEGLADLISADTEMQRRLAQEHAHGGVSRIYEGWAQRLTHARAMIEAELDFADEDDVPGSVSDRIWTDMSALQREIDLHLDGARAGVVIRDGFKVVISGPPNVGKSSLLNALARQDIAIVTDIPGTTRDVLQVNISLAGFVVKLFDTAGLRETADPVEQEGVRRARALLREAHLVLTLSDQPEGYADWDPSSVDVLKVGTKADLVREHWPDGQADVLISTKTPDGLQPLLHALQERLPQLSLEQGLALPSRRRHTEALYVCRDAIEHALTTGLGLDIQSEYLRQAGDALGRITGRVDVENLLDVIFSEFCIGK
jgi:tRNA modification GTPase